MADEVKPPQTRKWKWLTYAVTFFFGGAAPIASYQTFQWYQEWKSVKPLYDVFQTKGEAAMVAAGVEDLKKFTNVQHQEQLQAISALRKDTSESVKELRQYLDERRSAGDAIHLRLEGAINQNKIDIATLKFIVNAKTN